ncbi:MAG TPA: lysozyme inhibitor LprI family protein [Ureibacillus sp.]|nr:lysozyme inhibitor LprI family protein [Ureibacillus sp.]
MKKDRILLIGVLTLVIVILGACGNATSQSNTKLANQQSTRTLDEKLKENLSHEHSTIEVKSIIGNISVSTDTTQTVQNTVTTVQATKDSNTEETETRSGKNEMLKSKKEEYLQKLKSTKDKVNKLKAPDSSTYALKNLENQRWEIWDDLLNEIYGVIKEQLPPAEMEKLREEQRNWIKYRDKTAFKASYKYQGGTQELLEYVSVLANVTEERCYELVNKYMK